MRERAVQSASDTVNATDRDSLDLEFEQLRSEIDRIANSTEYNGMVLLNGTNATAASQKTGWRYVDAGVAPTTATLDVKGAQAGHYTITSTTTSVTITNGSLSQTGDLTEELANGTTDRLDANDVINFDSLGMKIQVVDDAGSGILTSVLNTITYQVTVEAGITFQVGSESGSNDQLDFGFASFMATHLGLSNTDIGDSVGNAQSAITALDTANGGRSRIGSMQNRLEFTSSNLVNSIQNNSASMSTVRDADFAAEAAELAKNQILTQSGTAMLAQANSLSQNVLSLIR